MQFIRHLLLAGMCAAAPLLAATWNQQAELTASDASSKEFFGCSIQVSGDTVVVGSNGGDPYFTLQTGHIYIYVRSGTTWALQQELKDPGGIGDGFGCTLALDGDTLLAGVAGGPLPSNEVGLVFVYVRHNGVWTLQQTLSSSAALPNGFGGSVALSGDTAVIGFPGQTVGTHTPGAAYVFVRSGGVWTQQQELTENGADGDFFGASVAVDGNTAVIGAPDKSNVHFRQGAAYVFTRKGTVWTKQQELVATDGATWNSLGATVALSGNVALIGAPNPKNDATKGHGAAYFFKRTGTEWAQQQKVEASDGTLLDGFGSVALSGNFAWIGAYETKSSSPKIPNQSAAYAYTLINGVWTLRQEIKVPTNTPSNGPAGAWVAVDGTTALIGAPGDGAAWVYVK